MLRLQEIDKPTPKDDEMLIRIHAASATAGDCEVRALKLPWYLRLPMRAFAGIVRPTRIRVLGQEFSGTIEAIGKDVQRFGVGDAVFGITGFGAGGYAEYMCRPEPPKEMDGVLTTKPEAIPFKEAAAISLGGLESIHFLRAANLQPDQRVLIIGAGGSIGTMGVQLAKHLGADVTAVDAGPKLDMLRSIGADHVIDYQLQDPTQSEQTFDVIFDVVGKTSIARGIKRLKDGGIYLLANPRIWKVLRGRIATIGADKRLISGSAVYDVSQLDDLKRLIEDGALRIVIDRTYPLEQTAEAHRYVETGQKTGNVIISVFDAIHNQQEDVSPS